MFTEIISKIVYTISFIIDTCPLWAKSIVAGILICAMNPTWRRAIREARNR